MMNVSGMSQYQQITKAVKGMEAQKSREDDVLSGDIDILELSAQGKKKAENMSAEDKLKAPQDKPSVTKSNVSVSDLHIAAQRYASLARKVQTRISMEF